VIALAPHTYTRYDIVTNVANKDGGAHIDPILTPEYERLSADGSLGSLVGRTEEGERSVTPIKDAHFTALRQIGFELLDSEQHLNLREWMWGRSGGSMQKYVILAAQSALKLASNRLSNRADSSPRKIARPNVDGETRVMERKQTVLRIPLLASANVDGDITVLEPARAQRAQKAQPSRGASGRGRRGPLCRRASQYARCPLWQEASVRNDE
jgi:hypothetical protein